MTPCRTDGFFEEIATGDIEVVRDSRHVERFSIDEETTLFRRGPLGARARPQPQSEHKKSEHKKSEHKTIVRPVPEELIRRVRERARASIAPKARSEERTQIRRAVILPWPMALMVLAVLGAVTLPHARRGDTRGALLYTLSSTRSAMTALMRPAALSEVRSADKASRRLRAAPVTAPEYLTITFAAPDAKKSETKPETKATPARAPQPPVTASLKAPAVKPVAKTASSGPAAAAKADALVRAQLE